MSASPERISIDGLAVTLHGPATGEAVLLSAGLGGLGGYWRPQMEMLSATYRVILYDHRGTGESDRSLPDPYDSHELALDMVCILDGLGLASAHLVGHAAGGIAGLALAALRPERVKSLAVINGWGVADPHFKRCFEIRTAIYRAGGPLAYLKAQPLFLFPAEWISRHLDELDEQAAHHAPGFQSEAALMARIGALRDFDIIEDLGKITCPVLVVGTEDDMLVPFHCSRDLAAGLPNATLVVLPRGGHAVTITETVTFNAHLSSFLATAGR